MDKDFLKPYTNKEIDLGFSGSRLRFAASQSLFSSHRIDTGTRHLLRTLEETDIQHIQKALDLGCGYGPLGISLAQAVPKSHIDLVDRDALAVAFAQHNAALHELSNTRAYGSLGYDDAVDRDFDLIVSNIPGKAGERVIRSLLLDARAYLAEDGRVAIVIVNPLDEMVGDALAQPDIEVLLHRTESAHTVIHYRFTSPRAGSDVVGAWERGIYDRDALTFLLDELTIPMKTVVGLPEFDTLGYDTILAFKALQDLSQRDFERISVFNPRQGLLPIVLWRRYEPRQMALVGRDLLALKTASLNLSNHSMPEHAITCHHQVPLLPAIPSPDLVVGFLRDDEGPEAIEAELIQAGAQLKPGTEALIIGGSTPITRVLKSQAINRIYQAVKRRRGKGNSTAILQRR
jgi:16S rRNA (guanine1207-N2)-methyltransferase